MGVTILADNIELLAIDPGNHVGIAARYTDKHYETTMLYEDYDQTLSIFKQPVQVVIIERFAAQQISSYGLYTVELIGAIKGVCWAHKIPVIMHTPQERYPHLAKAKAHFKQHNIKHVIHELDALAHLFCYEHDVTHVYSGNRTKAVLERLNNLA